MSQTKNIYTMTTWNETNKRDLPPPQRCTSVEAPGIIQGVLTGGVQAFYLLNYVTADTGIFSGYTFFNGKIGKKEGAFVLEDDGTFDTKSADTRWTIVPGSGTGALTGISGTGGFSATHGLTIEYEMEFTLPD